MTSVYDFLPAVKYNITEGGEYLWACFGKSAYSLSIEKNDVDGSVVFDTKTSQLYQVELWSDGFVYQWTDPDYIAVYMDEYTQRGCDKVDTDIEIVDVDSLQEIIDICLNFGEEVEEIS